MSSWLYVILFPMRTYYLYILYIWFYAWDNNPSTGHLVSSSGMDLWLLPSMWHGLGTCMIVFSNERYISVRRKIIVPIDKTQPLAQLTASRTVLQPHQFFSGIDHIIFQRGQKKAEILESLDESHDDRHGTWCHSRYHRQPAAISLQLWDRLKPYKAKWDPWPYTIWIHMAICFKTVWCFFCIENEGPLWWFLLGDSERSEDGSKMVPNSPSGIKSADLEVKHLDFIVILQKSERRWSWRQLRWLDALHMKVLLHHLKISKWALIWYSWCYKNPPTPLWRWRRAYWGAKQQH